MTERLHLLDLWLMYDSKVVLIFIRLVCTFEVLSSPAVYIHAGAV